MLAFCTYLGKSGCLLRLHDSLLGWSDAGDCGAQLLLAGVHALLWPRGYRAKTSRLQHSSFFSKMRFPRRWLATFVLKRTLQLNHTLSLSLSLSLSISRRQCYFILPDPIEFNNFGYCLPERKPKNKPKITNDDEREVCVKDLFSSCRLSKSVRFSVFKFRSRRRRRSDYFAVVVVQKESREGTWDCAAKCADISAGACTLFSLLIFGVWVSSLFSVFSLSSLCLSLLQKKTEKQCENLNSFS